jgi:uncharacterized membrane protein
MKRALTIAWISLGLLVLIYFCGGYEHLPEKFPTHFDLAGNPNGWSNKSTFLFTFGSLILFTNILLFILFQWIQELPVALINLPNKDYWFSTPERKLIGYEKLKAVLSMTGIFCNMVFLFSVQIIFQTTKAITTLEIPINLGVVFMLAMSIGLITAVFVMTRKPSSP